MRHDEKIKVLIPAKDIPTGSTVTKITGKKEYRLARDLRLFSPEGTKVLADENTVFLLDGSETINQYTDDIVLAWHTTPEELWSLVDMTEK